MRVDRSTRPFRIWDEQTHRDLPWRQYKTRERAVEKLLVLAHYLDVGNSYTAYATSGRVVLCVKRSVDGLKYLKE